MRKHILCVTALLLTQTVHAQQGYFDFGQIPGVNETPTVQVDLNAAMLGFVSAAAIAADPAAAELINGIDNVRVRVYDNIDDIDDLHDFIDDASGNLERDGWQRIVFVDDDEAKVRVYLTFDDVNATGITVMVAGEGDEAVFINVAGLINPTQLGQLAQRYRDEVGLSRIDLDGALEDSPAGRARDRDRDRDD